jgi:hypothetical protein
MSAQNRTDLKALVTAWTASLNLETTHKPTEQSILDSVLLNRDVKGTYNFTTSGYKDVDFDGKDTIVINTTTDIEINCANFNEGEVKYLIINKNTGNAITFYNATDQSIDLTYCNTLAKLYYRIEQKGGAIILAVPLHPTFDFAAIPAPETPGEWQQASLTRPWIPYYGSGRNGIWYRLNRGYIDITCQIYRTSSPNAFLTTLPSGYRPAFNYPIKEVIVFPDGIYTVIIQTDGQIILNGGGQWPTSIFFTASIPLT